MIAAILAIAELVASIASVVWAITKATAIIAAVSAVAISIFSEKGREKIAQLIANITRGALQVATPVLTAVEGDLKPIVSAFASAIQNNGAGIAEDLKEPFAKLGRAGLDAVTASLAKKGPVTPGDWSTNAGDALADAFGFGLASFGVSAAFEAAFPEKLNSLNGIGPMLATLAGFEEVTKNALGPHLRAAIGIPAALDANQQFRPNIPNLGALQNLLRRRIIDKNLFEANYPYTGLPDGWRFNMEQAAYRPIQPRALVTALQDVPFPKDKLREILEDNGFSDSHVNFMLDAFEYNSTKNVRNAYITAAETAYGRGVISDDELDQIITDAGWSDVARDLVKKRVLLARRTELAHEVETQVTALVANGLMDGETGLQQIEAAGVQEWLARLKITLAETKATLQAARKAAAAERHAEIQRQREATRAAIAEYRAGRIDNPGLTAALVASGLDAFLVASIVAVQDAERSGSLRLVYGRLLPPEAANVLRRQVLAIGEQRIKQLIGDTGVVTALRALKIDDAEIHALLARWAAAGAAPSKYAELLPSS